MKLNLKVRVKNPMFWIQILLSIIMPIFGYFGVKGADITSWSYMTTLLKDAVLNPYVLMLIAVSVFNAINDPTTKGIRDSQRALTYEAPSN